MSPIRSAGVSFASRSPCSRSDAGARVICAWPGGMGAVYRAIDTRLNRTVALKVLPPQAGAVPGRKRRFVQEAQSASALNHPAAAAHSILLGRPAERGLRVLPPGRGTRDSR